MRKLDLAGRKTWATSVKYLLCSYGFGFVWYSQDVGDISQFINKFRCRVIDCDKQRVLGRINESNHLRYFKEIKSLVNVEYYVNCINQVAVRRNICLLRLNSLPLRCNIRGMCVDRKCRMCDQGVDENMIHFLFECCAYNVMRDKYISVNGQLSLVDNYRNVLSSSCRVTLVNFSNYIKEALAHRTRSLH